MDIVKEILSESIILKPSTKFQQLRSSSDIQCYHASQVKDLKLYPRSKGENLEEFHVGSIDQCLSLVRNIFHGSNRHEGDVYYIYELIINLGNLYPKIWNEDPIALANKEEYDEIQKYDSIAYYNEGEHFRNQSFHNISVVLIHPDQQVKSIKPHGFFKVEKNRLKYNRFGIPNA